MRISEWQVREQVVAGFTFYQVYRTVDTEVQTHGGYWKHKKDAQDLCDKLNFIESGYREVFA